MISYPTRYFINVRENLISKDGGGRYNALLAVMYWQLAVEDGAGKCYEIQVGVDI